MLLPEVSFAGVGLLEDPLPFDPAPLVLEGPDPEPEVTPALSLAGADVLLPAVPPSDGALRLSVR